MNSRGLVLLIDFDLNCFLSRLNNNSYILFLCDERKTVWKKLIAGNRRDDHHCGQESGRENKLLGIQGVLFRLQCTTIVITIWNH